MLTNTPDYNTYNPSHPFYDYAYRSQISERRLEDRSQTAKDWEFLAKHGYAPQRGFIFEITFEF